MQTQDQKKPLTSKEQASKEWLEFFGQFPPFRVLMVRLAIALFLIFAISTIGFIILLIYILPFKN